MQYEMELTLVLKAKSEEGMPRSFDVHSIDTVKATSLTSLLGQFLLVIGTVHRRLMADFKTEHALEGMIDDDIPF